MKKAILISYLLMCSVVAQAEPIFYAYKVVVGKNSSVMSGQTAEGTALPMKVGKVQTFDCKLHNPAFSIENFSSQEISGIDIVIIPFEKNNEGVKTALRITETDAFSSATKLNANCTLPEGSSTSATLSTVAVLPLGQPQTFKLTNGSLATITVTSAQE